MLEQGVIELLESGCALVVGLVTAEGHPLAARGWGLRLADGGARARVLVNPVDLERLGHGRAQVPGTWIAVTGANVRTLSSAQLKGPVTAIDAVTDDDRDVCARYCEAYFDDVEVVDSIPRSLMERLVPDELVALRFDVVEAYDQTPGPGAGARLAGGDGAGR